MKEFILATKEHPVCSRFLGILALFFTPLDVTYWMEWFFKTLHHALIDAGKQLNYIVEKTKFWDAHREDELNARQVKVLNRLLDIGSENFKGDLRKAKYVKIANTAQTNASRDIADLLDKGCIKKLKILLLVEEQRWTRLHNQLDSKYPTP